MEGAPNPETEPMTERALQACCCMAPSTDWPRSPHPLGMASKRPAFVTPWSPVFAGAPTTVTANDANDPRSFFFNNEVFISEIKRMRPIYSSYD